MTRSFAAPLRLCALLLPLATAACGSSAPALSDLDGSWEGKLQTTGGTCPPTTATLIVSADHLVFTPSSGVLQLEGHRKSDDATLHAQLLLQDMNHKPLPMVFEGHSVVEQTPNGPALRIDGTYGTPSCRASVALRRPESRMLSNALGR